jgi:hypothetical protein
MCGHELTSASSYLLQIRFFERVKLERRLHRLEARLAAAQAQGGEAGGQALQQLQQQAEGLRQDLQYVKHFPKGEKYVSLLREADTPEAQVRRRWLLRRLCHRAGTVFAQGGLSVCVLQAPGHSVASLALRHAGAAHPALVCHGPAGGPGCRAGATAHPGEAAAGGSGYACGSG